MLIDWFTVFAQAVNFLFLVWLLKRYLYKPILDAIDAREKNISDVIAEATEAKQAAEMQRDKFERKNQQLNDDRDLLVLEMKKEINVQREQLLVDAHQSAEAISKGNTESMQRAQKTLVDEIVHQTQEQVFAISRKTLRDLADTSLEERIIQAFSRQLQNMHGSTKKNLSDALTKSSESVLVRSAFELQADQQDRIRQSVKEMSAADTPVRFEVAPNAIAGIELTSNGRRIAWSIDEYLISLQKSFSEATNPDTKAFEVNAHLESERIL
jgi:F-type H+-transporting ATPase subunit b